MSFLPHLTYFTLLLTSLSLYLYASKQLLHHTFLSHFPETNPCPWFPSVLVSLYSYLLYSTNVTTSHLIFYPFFSNAVLLGGISYILLYSYTFLHKECASSFLCYVSCSLATCTTHSSCFLFSTSILGHFHF